MCVAGCVTVSICVCVFLDGVCVIVWIVCVAGCVTVSICVCVFLDGVCGRLHVCIVCKCGVNRKDS